jgi:hypothetical protein
MHSIADFTTLRKHCGYANPMFTQLSHHAVRRTSKSVSVVYLLSIEMLKCILQDSLLETSPVYGR